MKAVLPLFRSVSLRSLNDTGVFFITTVAEVEQYSEKMDGNRFVNYDIAAEDHIKSVQNETTKEKTVRDVMLLNKYDSSKRRTRSPHKKTHVSCIDI